ncbi:leucine-rich repeat-containing protein [Vairimorpha apis BRL 01]|uniref:Leucine-rich repeat-containing protein n=1 Tax=Vairimorpha apis BRL 01 TaxID=1037528 RepID=T0LC34_9MICR|nr:leucine-rich repeat-containing protein [Vairimorpha apis BRL 01]
MAEIVSTDFSKCNLDEIQYTEINFKTSWLIISDNKLRKIQDDIKNLKFLTRLAANDNRISDISPKICNLTNLTWVDFTRNKLKSIPKEFHNLQKVTGLGLSENEFDEIPENIFKMVNLRKFGFFSNKVKSIHRDIRLLKNLIKLDLSNNFIKILPEEICDLTYLNWLNLSNNKLEKLPNNMNKLIHLEELGLGMNKLTKLPKLDKLCKLKILPLFKNNLTEVEDSIRYCRSIEKLDFSDNKIKKLPDFLLKLGSLRYLNCKGNLIEQIDDENLEYINSKINLIDLSENLLTCVPFKFFKVFNNLTTIKLEDNPYKYKKNIMPKKISLLEKCYNKLMNINTNISPSINILFNRIRICDLCEKYFVNEPYLIYNSNSLEEEHFIFVVEKTCCSIKCYKKETLINK